MLDVVFDMHPNLPRKKAILERIRQVNGQTDPNGKISPEQQQAQAQQQAKAAAEYEAQMAQLQATIKEAQAKGVKLEAEAVAKSLEGIYMAAQAAQVLTLAPQITPVADELLKSAGFNDMAVPQPVIDGQVPVQQMQQMPELQQADGAMAGIETAAPDGVQQFP